MTYSRLELINHTLSLIGENKLTTSDNQLGALVVNVLNTAIATVAQETRHNCFEQIEQPRVTQADYLLPSYDIPDAVIQILGVNCRVSVEGFGDVLDVLPYIELSELDVELGYSVVNGSIYISKNIARPLTLFIHTIQTKELPVSDSDLVKLPNQVVYATAHTAASILCLSYLDNPNAASVQRNLAQTLIEKLTKQQGIGRSKSFSLKPKNNKLRGLSTQYNATLYLNKATADATYLSITDAASTYQNIADMSNYYTSAQVDSTFLTQANANNTYLTSLNAANTFLTQANAASIYLTQANAASTYLTQDGLGSYAELESPVFTGTPTAPTAAPGTATTQIATTDFVRQELTAGSAESWQRLTLSGTWTNYASSYGVPQYRKVGDIVYTRGLIKKSNDNTEYDLFILPDGYRPPAHLLFITTAGSPSLTGTINLSAYSSGKVTRGGGTIPLNSWRFEYVAINFSFSVTA